MLPAETFAAAILRSQRQDHVETVELDARPANRELLDALPIDCDFATLPDGSIDAWGDDWRLRLTFSAS